MSNRLPAIPFLREQIATQRALCQEQPGVIRLSCFDAEEILERLDALERVLEASESAVTEWRWGREQRRESPFAYSSMTHLEDALKPLVEASE